MTLHQLPDAYIPKESEINHHKAVCTICKLPPHALRRVNEMILTHHSERQIFAYVQSENLWINPASLTYHKKFLPYILPDDQVVEVMEKARRHMLTDSATARITEMEDRVVTERIMLLQKQAETTRRIWETTIPAMLQRLEREVMEGQASIKDIAYAFDVITRNSILIAGGPTERMEVTTKHEHIYAEKLQNDPEVAELAKQLFRRTVRAPTVVEVSSED